MQIQELLSGRNLTKMVQEIKSGLPLVVPEAALTPTDTVPGNTFEYAKVNGNRDLARIVARGSPARRIGHQDVTYQKATMLDSAESQAFRGDMLLNLVNIDAPEQRQNKGEQEILRQTTWFKKRQVNLLQASVQHMLLNFGIHVDELGNILPDSTGAMVSATAGIPAGQLNQLDILGSGAIIGASWGTAGTDIVTDIFDIILQMMQLGGYLITEAYYGKNIPGFIFGNTTAKEWINRNPTLSAQAFARNEVPAGFQALNWHPASHGYYIDAAGSVQTFIGDDDVVFTPAISDDWWRMAYGSNLVPTGPMSRGADASDMLAQVEEVFGPYSYAELLSNPVRIEQYAGVTWLPMIVATKAVCKGDMTP